MMRSKFAEVLELGRKYWDYPGADPHVRAEFSKVCKCGTEVMGGVEWTDGTRSKIVYYTCKSRMCPQCGKKATQEWLRQTWRELPNKRYLHIVFTMPSAFWEAVGSSELFERSLCRMAAACVEEWYFEKSEAIPYIAAITHTYGEDLKYNPHVHLIASAGGYRERDQKWVAQYALLTYAENRKLMLSWRGAILRRLHLLSERGRLQGDCRDPSYIDYIDRDRQTWQVMVSLSKSKMDAMEYAMRYARHPPISNRRIINFSDDCVSILCPKHHDPEKPLPIPLEKFISLLARHVRGHYEHSMRYFDLLTPRLKGRLKFAVFKAIGEPVKSKPCPRSFRQLALKSFGEDPLAGMKPTRKLKPGK
jgi:hypothetical protein